MSDLELLKRYLQNEIDDGNRKLFVFDKDYNVTEFKTIDALNEINDLQNKLQQKENIIKEVREYITYWHYRNDFIINSFTTGVKEELLEILDKENK